MEKLTGFIASELPTLPQPAFSRFHVIPVPLEASVSYGQGTASGPAAILEASQQLEAFDGRSVPLDEGIYTAPPVNCQGKVVTVLDRITAAVIESLDAGGLPVVLGGEHTVTLGALRAVARHFPGPVGLIQLDAHADLRDSYQGSCFSHACVARRAVDDLGMPLFQFGVRALSLEEHRFRQDKGILHLDSRTFYKTGIPTSLLPDDFPGEIYLTLDVDGLDPSVIRSTGTPVPGGLFWQDVMTILEAAIQGRRVIGFDVVELAPNDTDPASDFAAAQLVYTVMGMIQRNQDQ